MEQFYRTLDSKHYFWDRKDKNTIWVALPGYKVFSDSYYVLMQAAAAAGVINIAADYDRHSGKTFYTFQHK